MCVGKPLLEEEEEEDEEDEESASSHSKPATQSRSLCVVSEYIYSPSLSLSLPPKIGIPIAALVKLTREWRLAGIRCTRDSVVSAYQQRIAVGIKGA